MRLEFDAIPSLEEQIKRVVISATKEAIEQTHNRLATKEWMDLKTACAYAGVSNNTFMRFREMGLKVCEIDGVKRVSKKEIDLFLEKHSY